MSITSKVAHNLSFTMSNTNQIYPDFFYLRAPLPESVTLINFKEDQPYWALSVGDESRNSYQTKKDSDLAPYDDNETEMLDCCDLEDNYEINPTKSGRYITSFYVSPILHGVIVGARGSKLRQLQDNTNTLIKVPKPNAEDAIVKISGPSERSVASARTQISLLLLAKRERMSITHFISIPMYSENIRRNFEKFKDEILGGVSIRGVDQSIFQRVEKMHLTIITLVLLGDKEIEDAKAILKKYQNNAKKLFENRKIQITMKGVEIMNDDPSEADILYGKVSLGSVEETEKFHEFASELLDAFYRGGFVKRQYDNIKLHVTLMNSLFRNNDGFQRELDNHSNKRESFDASLILDKYKDYYFGKTTCDRIHLSVRFTTAHNGYYQNAGAIHL